MLGLGLSINVISLASLFAVGMVVDTSIVSLEHLPTDSLVFRLWRPLTGGRARFGLGFSTDDGCCLYPHLDIDLPVGELLEILQSLSVHRSLCL